MHTPITFVISILFCSLLTTRASEVSPVTVSGELREWHTVTLNIEGPSASESDIEKNPFLDYRLEAIFTNASKTISYKVPGYFAADGNAGESGAVSGNIWKVHFTPDRKGTWAYRLLFQSGPEIAVSVLEGEAVPSIDGFEGQFVVAASNKKGRDFRGKGRLRYIGRHHQQFGGNGKYFLKAGPDAPETLLAYVDFDNTHAMKSEKVPLKTWAPHLQDWKQGDPTWKDGKGKGLIGALNYLSNKGMNTISFLPYNAGGDGDNVWPFVDRDDKLHYDCSKLDQWGIVFAYAQQKGLHLHFKLQETEIDDLRQRNGQDIEDMPTLDDGSSPKPESLDGGKLGVERKLYLRELIARFGHHLALNWNLGEENTQTPEEQKAMADYIYSLDPYHHNLVIHTYPDMQEIVYEPLIGNRSVLTGASLQNMWDNTHERTYKWVTASAVAGRPWIVANDEQGSAGFGAIPDPGYEGFSGTAGEGDDAYDLHDIRKYTLWGNLMAGGAGVEYYFGYKLPQNDLIAEDFRSRDQSWDYCRIALEFFNNWRIPFWKMQNRDELVGNPDRGNSVYCLAKSNEVYLVYLPQGGSTELDMSGAIGEFEFSWFNPRNGGSENADAIVAGKTIVLSAPDEEDWLAVIRKP